jgi:hypothetical protein
MLAKVFLAPPHSVREMSHRAYIVISTDLDLVQWPVVIHYGLG